MINDMLNEELGISNDVITLVNRIKNLISDNYGKNKHDKSLYGYLRLSNGKKILSFCNTINIKFNNDILNVTYYVVDCDNDNLEQYNIEYSSSFDLLSGDIELFLHTKNNKINWIDASENIQHEIQHWYQQKQKGKSLLNNKKISKYIDHSILRNSNNNADRIIGFVYYYYERIEYNAVMNGLYSTIMSYNEHSYIAEPVEILKNYHHYKKIKTLKDFIDVINSDEEYKNLFIDILKQYNKNFSSFMRIVNTVVNEYIRGFGKTLYKAKKDLEEKYKYTIY